MTGYNALNYSEQGGDVDNIGGTLNILSTGKVTKGGNAVVESFTIGLADSATTDGMDITITAVDALGATVAKVVPFEMWISEATTGIGLTADTYSGTVTAATGAIHTALTAKKHFLGVTAATGIAVITAVASANPADQYVVVRHPAGDGVVVSAASGTNWEGV
jgi:hypothetical protein